MLAVHFGAGNIGRGFIGQMLFASGYEICFIDVNQHVIDDINSLKQYYI
jgi:mannitol-1-phosphate 5-dehydrogenase